MRDPQTRPSRALAARAAYARTPNSFLVNDPAGFPSDFPPAMWWTGLDSGGGSYPIGPNGPWPSGVAPSAAVIRATALITGPLTAAPFRVLDAANVGMVQSSPRWLADPMLLRPTWDHNVSTLPAVLRLPRGEFWSQWIRSAIWRGIGAFVYTEDSQGQPLAGTLRLLNPLDLVPSRADGGLRWVVGATTDQPESVFDDDNRYEYADLNGRPWADRLVVLRNPHSPIDHDGNSAGVFELAPSVFRLAGQIDTYASGTFRSGVPAGYLKVTAPGLTPDNAANLRSRWLAAHGGDRRSIAVLNSTTEFHALNLSPVDAALDQVKRLNLADVAFAFGLDPMTLGAGLNNSATYTNLRDAWENHRDFGLALWISGVQDTLSALLAGTTSVTVNLDGFANPAASERFASYKTALDAGILTVDEVRALEGLAPMPADQLEPVPPQPPREIAQ